MELLSSTFAMVYQFIDTFAFLILSSLGLAIIFGMMGIVNLAHGEFIMCGAYVTVFAHNQLHIPLFLAVICGALAAAIAGFIVERLIIRHLYHRPLDSIVATWGVSLIVTQLVLVLLGPTMQGIGTPFGSFQILGFSYSIYRIVLFIVSLFTLCAIFLLLNKTTFGIKARSTIQNPHMASALGINTSLIYTLTFAFGTGLAGLAGGLYAPTITIVPTLGATFITEAFVTVMTGGADIFFGTTPAAGFLAVIKSLLTSWKGQLIGQVGMLVTVIIVVRFLPKGISGLLLRERN